MSYVIYKQVGGFYYYANVLRLKNKIQWEGLTDNATKFPDKQTASIKAEFHSLNPEQIKKI